LIDQVNKTDCIEQPMRFGNRAFRVWHEKVTAEIDTHLSTLSKAPGFERSFPEIKVYMLESFGSYERLDYGTGHELNFVVFLFSLFKMGVLIKEDLRPAINKVFAKYMDLMRLIQSKYCLEPAGSHGVWGLDDY